MGVSGYKLINFSVPGDIMLFRKALALFSVLLICSLSVPAYAQEMQSETMVETETENNTETNTETESSMWPELILRPVGVASSAVGFGLFLACSPFSALATIAEPHDALKVTYNAFVVTPFKFTFTRPLGDYDFNIK